MERSEPRDTLTLHLDQLGSRASFKIPKTEANYEQYFGLEMSTEEWRKRGRPVTLHITVTTEV